MCVHTAISINIQNSRFQTNLYDKRDNFNFNISRMPSESSNIPKKMFCLAASAEILRICKATTKFQDFKKSAEILIGRIRKQKGLINHTKKVSLKLFTKNGLLNLEKLIIIL